ncbi:17-beta-hydroxysteroid dehydrogenase type 6-like [Anabrus simplex]|uniref:17-beta-hydroxysteroid dehydrogenase type 6-like n=1 Tax=Anabrus simplex TaxID=316456 RepID=UPI0035A2DF3A
MPSLTMIRRTGIFFTCLVVSYTLVRLLLDKDVSALILYCALGLTLGRIMYAAIRKLLPIELLPELHKKAIFITGCDTGFGHLPALRADSLGLLVYAGCLHPEGDGAKALKEKCSDRTHIVSLDVTNDKLVEAAAQYVKSTLGDKVLWAVVNNAGIAAFAEVEWHSIDSIKKIFDINVYGQLRVTRALLPLLRESKGRVVNVNSAAAFVTLNGITPYSASKHASVAFTEGLRQELQKFSISVHSIEPAFYRTPIMQNLFSSAVWEGCPLHIKEVYGEDYFKLYQARDEYILSTFRLVSNRVNDVVDGMIEASVGVNPPDSISPSLIDWVMKTLVIYAPTVAWNFFKDLFQPKLPTFGNWIVNKLQAMSKEKEEKIRQR